MGNIFRCGGHDLGVGLLFLMEVYYYKYSKFPILALEVYVFLLFLIKHHCNCCLKISLKWFGVIEGERVCLYQDLFS